MRFSRHQLLALVLGAGMTSALPAQNRTPPARPRPGAAGARGGAGAAMRRPPGPAAMMINDKDQLGLTDDQVAQLQAMEMANASAPMPLGDLLQIRRELQTASAGEANLDAVRAAMDKMGKLQSDMLVARLDARNKARAILSADQQVKFDALEASQPLQLQGLGGALGAPNSAGAGRGGAGARLQRQGAPPPSPIPPASK